MNDWERISTPPGKNAAKILANLAGMGCLLNIILLPIKVLFVAWRLNVLYNWEGVWTNGLKVSVRVFHDGQTMRETLFKAFITGTAWDAEKNDAEIIKNPAVPRSSPFGDLLILSAPGNAPFPPIEVLDANATIVKLEQVIEAAKTSTLNAKTQVAQVDRKSRLTVAAQQVLDLENEVERLRQQRGGGK